MTERTFNFGDLADDGRSLSLEEMQALMTKQMGGRPGRDGRICICGHPITSHTGWDPEENAALELTGRTVRVACRPTKIECPCALARPVILTRDTRKFLHITTGSSAFDHALKYGVQGCNNKQIDWAWYIPRRCDRCTKDHSVDNPVDAYGINQEGRIQSRPAQGNVLLCRSCKEDLW